MNTQLEDDPTAKYISLIENKITGSWYKIGIDLLQFIKKKFDF